MQFRNTLGPCILELVGWQIFHYHSHGVRESVEGENMLGVNSLHELTGGHELRRTAWMTHDNMADHN